MNALSLALDHLDAIACRLGVLKAATWEDVRGKEGVKLYAGRLFRSEQQFRKFIGLSYTHASSRNIRHDMRRPFPLEDNSVSRFQSQDVFEHIEYEALTDVIEEIYRVLMPGGLFRLSVPDYRFDGYRDRCVRDPRGAIVFDPGGGGRFEAGKIVDGGHVWFPVYENVSKLLLKSSFGGEGGSIDFLHCTKPDGSFVLRKIDHSLGRVKRTPDFDIRSSSPRRPQSIVVDCRKA